MFSEYDAMLSCLTGDGHDEIEDLLYVQLFINIISYISIEKI